MADENNAGENQDEKNQFKSEEDMSEEERTQLQSDEDYILNFKDEDRADPDKVDKLDKALANAKTTIHQKRHYRTKFNELNKAETDAKAKLDEEKKKELDKKTAAEKTDDKLKVTTVELVEFRQDNKELSKEVAKEILEYAKISGITTEEAMKKSVIKSLIKTSTTKEDIEDAGIPPKQGGAAGGEIAEKDWSTASEADINAQRAKMGAEG